MCTTAMKDGSSGPRNHEARGRPVKTGTDNLLANARLGYSDHFYPAFSRIASEWPAREHDPLVRPVPVQSANYDPSSG